MLNNLKPNSSFFKKGSVIIAGAGPGDINKITLQSLLCDKILRCDNL